MRGTSASYANYIDIFIVFVDKIRDFVVWLKYDVYRIAFTL
jgi:hypothetical protein